MKEIFTIPLTGSIDTVSSADFEKTIDSALAELSGRDLVLDAENLDYISSMGLRVLFSLRKKIDFKLVNVSPVIYELLQTVGFDTIINIEKALRKIDVEGCEIIGKGINGTVYRLSEDLIAKVYNEKIPLDMIKKERSYAQAAFLSGLPTAISYDTVRNGNNYGIVFEMLDAQTFANKLHGNHKDFEHYARIYAETLKQIHSTKADTATLPSAADKYNSWIDQLQDLYTEHERELMHKMINSLPARDTTIHGDFHMKNIMIKGNEPLLIDMADVSYGHPMFDFACTTLTHRLYPAINPETNFMFMGVDMEEVTRVWWILLETYFGTSDKARLEEIDRYLMNYALLRYGLQPAVLPQIGEEERRQTVAMLRERLFPSVEEVINKVFF